MADVTTTARKQLPAFLGGLGAILLFALIIFVAYLPNRPPPVDAQVQADRRAKAQEAVAAGLNKTTSYAVVDKENGIVRIPVEEAMRLTLRNYQAAPDNKGE